MVASQVVARECTLRVCVLCMHVFKQKQENRKMHAVSDNCRPSLSLLLLFIYSLVPSFITIQPPFTLVCINIKKKSVPL